MKCESTRVLASACCLLLSCTHSNGSGDPIVDQVISAHQQRSEQLENLQIRCTERSPTGLVSSRWFWRIGSKLKLHSIKDQTSEIEPEQVLKSPEFVESFGDTFLFRLRRQPGGQDLIVRDVVFPTDEVSRETFDSLLNSRLDYSIESATSVMGVPLGEMLGWSDTVVSNVSETEEEMSIAFECSEIPNSPLPATIVSATVTLSKSNLLCITEHEYLYSTKQNGKTYYGFDSSKRSYDEHFAKGLIPTLVRTKAGASGNTPQNAKNSASDSSQYSFEDVKFGEVADSDFLPAYYGFPNHLVGMDEKSRFPPMIWVVIGANALLFVWWVVRRRRMALT